jgi:predicted oxidoreductase
MAFSDKQAAFKYVNEYTKQKYDRITILRKNGEKVKLDAIAKEKGYRSTTEFINQCIDEKLKRMKVDL